MSRWWVVPFLLSAFSSRTAPAVADDSTAEEGGLSLATVPTFSLVCDQAHGDTLVAAAVESGSVSNDSAQEASLKLEAVPAMKPSVCGDDMVEVEGEYCSTVEQKCLKWLDAEKMRCAEFAPTSACQGKTTKKHFCIDKYEYPNKAGEMPGVMKTWYEAKATCEKSGKRLCGDTEWTVAGEGQERRT